MKKEIGLWIDHREAIIVILRDGTEEIKHIESDAKAQDGSNEATSEDRKDRKFANDLNKYYDEVIAVMRQADAIKIFGPGEAKGELEKRITHAGLSATLLATETADKMTDHQVASKVRDAFPA